MSRFQISLLTAVVITGFASVTQAADMAVKAPPRVLAPAPVYNWTGFYGGVNIGYGWATSSNTWNIFDPSDNVVAGPACEPAGGALCLTGSNSSHPNGALGGLQFGYNLQFANYLAGIEADIHITGQSGNYTFNSIVPTGALVSAAYTEKLPWFGTLRGRIGFTSDHLLFYGTGGLAYGEVKMNGSATISGANAGGFVSPPCTALLPTVGTCPLAAWSNSDTKVGFAVGGGVEGVLIDKWTWKIEYLYVDLGKVNTAFATPPVCFSVSGSCTTAGPGTGTISSMITDSIVRVGLNYQFH